MIQNDISSCFIIFFTPPTSDVMQGMPNIIASPTEFGEFSITDELTKTLDARNRFFISFSTNGPVKTTFSLSACSRMRSFKYFPYELILYAGNALIFIPAIYSFTSGYVLL